MKRNCPNPKCKSSLVKKDGSYFRKSDSRRIQRFKCHTCKKKFSSATFSLEYRQKKRRVNHMVFKLLCSGVSQRRCADILGINPKTVARKLKYLGKKSRLKHDRFMKNYKINELQFDDLITSHHSKLKPLTVPVFIDSRTRLILSAEVGQIPAFGHIAKTSRKKYGKRKCEHRETLERSFETLRKITFPEKIMTDDHKTYPVFVRKYCKNSTHLRFTSRPASVVGQGEMKKGGYDPLFAINHTLAMLRANINRLFRRTWCTTKDINRLKDHLDIYIWFHNCKIIENSS